MDWTDANGGGVPDLLTSGVMTMQANDPIRVAFGDNHPVAFFPVTERNNPNVIFTDQAPRDKRSCRGRRGRVYLRRPATRETITPKCSVLS